MEVIDRKENGDLIEESVLKYPLPNDIYLKRYFKKSDPTYMKTVTENELVTETFKNYHLHSFDGEPSYIKKGSDIIKYHACGYLHSPGDEESKIKNHPKSVYKLGMRVMSYEKEDNCTIYKIYAGKYLPEDKMEKLIKDNPVDPSIAIPDYSYKLKNGYLLNHDETTATLLYKCKKDVLIYKEYKNGKKEVWLDDDEVIEITNVYNFLEDLRKEDKSIKVLFDYQLGRNLERQYKATYFKLKENKEIENTKKEKIGFLERFFT